MRERESELAEERENNCSHFASTSFCLPSLSSLLVLGRFRKNGESIYLWSICIKLNHKESVAFKESYHFANKHKTSCMAHTQEE